MAKPRIGVYPGTFDPITNGHVDIIRRATRVVDKLIVGVATNIGKQPLFDIDERVDMVRDEIAALGGDVSKSVEATPFDILLMDFVVGSGASIVLRGLRAVSDFEYEFQMAGMNARLNAEVETVFLMASESHQFISSRFVKEIALLDGDVSSFVPPRALERIKRRVAE